MKTLNDTVHQLWRWSVPQDMWVAARARGCSEEKFTALYRDFVRTYYGKVNYKNEFILADKQRARWWAFAWLSESGFPPPQRKSNWQHTYVTTKDGRKLPWRVYTNDKPINTDDAA